MRRLVVGVALVLALGAGGARAQGLALGLYGGYMDMSASENSAQAVFGSTGTGTFGGELAYNFSAGFYLAAGARSFKKEGERVFLADRTAKAFGLGHPLSLRLVPAYLTIGYRFRRNAFLVPYVGVGGGLTSYREESTVAGLTTKQEETKASGHALVGLEVGRGMLRFGVEAAYATVPDTIGTGLSGVSRIYGEDDVGGFTVVGKIIVTRPRR